MNILIVYGTYSGGTLSVAHEIEELLKASGHTVTLQNILTTSPSGEYEYRTKDLLELLKSNDLVIFGSCTWLEDGVEGQMHSGFKLLDKELSTGPLEKIRCAVYGLGDRNYAHFCGAVDQLEKMVTGRRGKLITPSLRIDRYFFNTDKALKDIKDWVGQLSKSVQRT